MGKCSPITRIIPASVAWILLLCATGIFFVFPCRYLMSTYTIGIPIFQGVITFFVVTNFALATFVNPGVIPKASTDELKGDGIVSPTYKDIEINGIKVRLKWCVTCQFYRPPRCVHCGICDTCIETFDHHCPWVNNCIGRRNYRYFFMFLLWLSVHMISILCLCSVYMKDHLDDVKMLSTMITLVIIGIIIILFIPILGLTVYHLILIIRGKTTNEQVRGKFLDEKNPYSRGCCKNILYILCNSPLPRFKSGGTFYSLSNHYSMRSLKEQSFHESQSSNSFKSSSVQFKYSDKADYMLPKQSLSSDFESSPSSYLSREGLHLSLSESLYTRPETHTRNKGSRALTPPVPIRFDCSRRSLPPHNRLHAPSPHYVVAQSVHSSAFSKDSSRTSACTSGQSPNPNFYCSQGQNSSVVKYDYGATSADVCGPNSNFYSHLYKRKDVFSKPEGISYTPPESSSGGKVLASDTCCLGNQTVDKFQEIANRTIIGGQCTDVSVLEAFPKGCSSFHNSPSKEHHDGHQLLIAHTPQQLFVNNCVDCQQTSANHSCQSSVSGEFARTPGNRPLSFVKAMEMSETMDWTDNDPQHSRISGVSHHPKVTQILSPIYKVASPNANIVPEYKTKKGDSDVSYEISV